MDELVSVIIPAYNHERYIRQAIESVINQTYDLIELLVIDDGSTDKTWDIICSLKPVCEKRFYRTFFDQQTNQGTCVTLNRLLAEANGIYITSLASDDLMIPDLTEEGITFLQHHPDYQVVHFDATFIDEDSKAVFWDEKRRVVHDRESAKYLSMADWLRKSRPDVDFLSSEFGTYESLLKGNYIPSAPFFCRSLLEKTGVYAKSAPLEDWYLSMQMAKHTRLKFIDKPLWRYRWHPANTAKQKKRMTEMARLTWLYEIRQAIAGKDETVIAAMHQHCRREKTILDWGKVKLYKSKSFDGKKIVLRLGSKEFSTTYSRRDKIV